MIEHNVLLDIFVYGVMQTCVSNNTFWKKKMSPS
jgi:hypothetical protein